jgi:glycosyltransferase involved in cell wall biosynthesis
MPPKVREALSGSYKRIAMSKFGVAESHKAGLDCYYVPHGVDTNIYKPQNKQEARKMLKLPEDAWIVGTVAMNKGIPSRKSLPAMLQAFANFKRKHTDAIYFLHTQYGDGRDGLGGVNMPEICGLLGLKMGKDVFITDPYAMALGMSDEFMSNLYSAMDVHILASMGEGFGVPIIEAQACGVPVIVGGWTAMPELVRSGHIIDKADAEPIWTGIASYQWQPTVKSIERKMELEYRKPSPNPRDAIVKEYDIEVVFKENMLPALMDIEKELAATKQRYAEVAEARQ